MMSENNSKTQATDNSETVRKYREYVITSFVKSVQPVVAERASGAVLTDETGKEYIDCFAGISVVNAGHCNPEVVAAAKEQLDRLIHCCSYVYYSKPTADLAELMAQITPGKLRKTFFCNSGAEGIEGALKIAKLHTGKHEILALQTSFHGRTFGTLSVTGNAGRKRRGGPYAPGVTFLQSPGLGRARFHSDGDFISAAEEELENAIRYSTSGDVAAFIAEPVLGEGGIIVPPRDYFRRLKKILDRHGILFIADEVQSGFARTGKMFAIEHFGVEPDILVTAKGIADGFPLGAFTVTKEIAGAFQPGDHLSTFGGNPVSCAAGIASIQFLLREKIAEHSAQLGKEMLAHFRAIKSRAICEVRGLGLMIGIELVSEGDGAPSAAKADEVRSKCREQGVLVGVGGVNGNVIRFQPPLIITREQAMKAADVIERCLS